MFGTERVKQKYVKTKCLKIGETPAIEQNVVEISTYEEGVFKTYRPNQDYSSPMQPGEGELDRFKCGHMYSITLKKEGVIEMENMYPSNESSIQRKYGVSTTCELSEMEH